MSKNKGFTLIELLVVIAIIGILASVVLASLNSARAKGADAAIKANLTNTRAQAELYYDSNGSSYGATAFAEAACADNATGNLFADANIEAAIAGANSQASGTVTSNAYTQTVCASSATSWAAAVTLRSDSTKSWCVDSQGVSREVATPATNAATITGDGTTATPYACS